MTAFWIAATAWGLGELSLIVWTSRGGVSSRDVSTTVLSLTVLSGVVLAALVAGSGERSLPGPEWLAVAVGVALLIAGFGLRVWAVRTLGRFFKYRVVVQENHEVIQTGPYRLVRHPSYTGMVMCAAGLGLMLDDWLALIVAALPTLIAFTLRLLSEERTLAGELGEPYREYMARTWRLVPHVW
jgi:protein-S-isoprenylcysteine O-methyltransferase Ste14